MKTALLFLSLLFAASALADDPPTVDHGAQQEHGEYGPVPYPLPANHPFSVCGVATPEYRERFGLLSAWHPPFTALDVERLNYAVEFGMVKLFHCRDEES